MNYFKGLIVCTKCKKHYNAKKNGNQKGFICSGYKNYGKDFCNSSFIHLDILLDIIQRHCEIHNKDWNITKTKLFILRIEIGDEITIRWRDGLVSIISDSKVIF